ncbi:MAG TPA: PilZ domain-containing protein [Labilithrix sp.]|jgi:hypothetical protein
MSDSDRRSGGRVDSIVVVQLEGAGHSIARNASERGLLIATRTELVVGDHLEITVRGRSTTHRTKARVVRVEKTPPSEAWPFRAALDLADALPPELIEEGSEAAAIFLRPGSIPPSSG